MPGLSCVAKSMLAAFVVTFQVVRLQDRNSSLQSELEEIKTARSNRSMSSKAVEKGQAALDAAAAAAKTVAAYSAADKELMLKQIDSLKEVGPTLLARATKSS